MNPFRRLRITFIAIAEASVIGLLSAIFLVTVLTTNAHVDARADEMISFIHERPGDIPHDDPNFPREEQMDGSFPEGEGFAPHQDGQGEWGGDGRKPGSNDNLAGLRYFIANIDADGNKSANVAFIFAFTEEDALTAAEKAVASNSEKGYSGDYRYNVFSNEKGKEIIFLDWSNQLEPSRTFTLIASIVTGAGSLIVLAILIPISKLVSKPLETADKKQRKFISDASHEMKTPLAIISANNEIIEMMHGEDETTTAISKQVNKMTEMIRSFSALVKLGQLSKSNFAEVNLTDIAYELATDFKPAFEKSGIRFETSIQDGLRINGLDKELKTLMSTILDNARKYGKSFCLFSLYKNQKGIVLRVKNDHSQSLNPGPMDEVFNRFYRSDDARGSTVEGSGIGLSIAKEIASLHHAQIHCYVTESQEFVIEATF